MYNKSSDSKARFVAHENRVRVGAEFYKGCPQRTGVRLITQRNHSIAPFQISLFADCMTETSAPCASKMHVY